MSPRRKNKLPDPLEKEIVPAIMEFLPLQYPKSLFVRVEPPGTFEKGRLIRKPEGSGGVGDISVLHYGLGGYLEVKTRTGRQSPKQKEFEARVNKAGGFYRVVRSVEDAQKAMEEINLRIRGKYETCN